MFRDLSCAKSIKAPLEISIIWMNENPMHIECQMVWNAFS